jgi:uncharacterized membrane protein
MAPGTNIAEAGPAAGSTAMPLVRRVDPDRPWAWLAAGWRDLVAAVSVSLVYGAFFAVVGLALTIGLWRAGVWYLVLPLVCGFLLVGPIAAVGLYAVSGDLQAGRRPSLAMSLEAFRTNPTQIAFFGVVLLLFFIAWARLAVLIFMLFFGLEPPPLQDFIGEVFFSARNILFIAVGFGVGGILAALAFAISVVSIPLLLDRSDANVVTAIITSLKAVQLNPLPMIIWAGLIALFIGAGLVTLFLGLVVTLPLIAHASWHAYRDLVEPPAGATAVER